MLSPPLRRYADQKLREYCEREGIAAGRFEPETQLVAGFAADFLHGLAVEIAAGAARVILGQLRLGEAARRRAVDAAVSYAKSSSKDWQQFPVILSWVGRGVHNDVTHPWIRRDEKKRESDARQLCLPLQQRVGEDMVAALPAMVVQRDKAGHDRYVATYEAPANVIAETMAKGLATAKGMAQGIATRLLSVMALGRVMPHLPHGRPLGEAERSRLADLLEQLIAKNEASAEQLKNLAGLLAEPADAPAAGTVTGAEHAEAQ